MLFVKNLSLSFKMYTKGFKQRNVETIKDISLSVNEGEVVAIIGSSGSGKSLLAHAIFGILPNNATVNGEMYFNNKLMTQEYIKSIRGREIALVPQSVTYFDQLMPISKQIVGDNVSQEAQRKAFERYGLTVEDEKLYPYELSGGMARRALISTAVASGAKLIVADEPTPGLSEDLSKEVLQNFKELADEGCGVLLITHDIDLALQFSNRIYIFYDGRVIDHIKTEDFLAGNITEEYTRALYYALPQNGFNV
ncbi:peptide ABC transporter ATP-binding protein [Candidatus Epulonipiscium fishelsonii]|uniref:Peptide ABC transporter ATP-binding protein n=1 Tax=Candidatus Epulonipiscium fishelsonii TaxID=77094 RepID=A0ACC8XD51_9FIRM|nr:peptide ABC transporter ATP-binding protein [Epulopiscium sp. SCG-B11WGA-EpuloA1]ONI41782.1 peptide ABC transporter ATP-binding protein [Epulopiscium sp. SCG-B05WGA-EpuloA1]ONI47889.1 peptide ABC transporter ATP-binding protein [Epulopiscium sp. SCG-C06WGA-EpuloA1]